MRVALAWASRGGSVDAADRDRPNAVATSRLRSLASDVIVNNSFTIDRRPMAQSLKEDVQSRIRRAALAAFAERGFLATTMAQIGEDAGVSTGNVYRYYENKQVLFDAVVPAAVARDLSTLLRRRVRALVGAADALAQPEGSQYHAASAELFALAVEHRLALVVLLTRGRADGTGLANYASRTCSELVALALEHGASAYAFAPTHAERFVLGRIYESFVETLAAILHETGDASRLATLVEGFSRYHLAGMRSFFERRRA